jgi:hypothetical protein
MEGAKKSLWANKERRWRYSDKAQQEFEKNNDRRNLEPKKGTIPNPCFGVFGGRFAVRAFVQHRKIEDR